jgi:NADH:ubiquinone oxidoreductase subunit 3 (subunit A)
MTNLSSKKSTFDLPSPFKQIVPSISAASLSLPIESQQQSADSWLYFDSYFLDYNKVITTFIAAFLLCLLLFVVSYFLSFSRQKEYEKTSEYECGFEPFDNATRQPFDVHFYIVGILFLIFDVEIALLFPWSAGLDNVGVTGFWNMMLFLVILTVGFVYEWKRGALSWSNQDDTETLK